MTYNEESRIQACLESLLLIKNHVSSFRVVLVDNNSSDKTASIALDVLTKLKFDFLILRRNQNNLAQARNDILNAAKTRWVYMLDADCRIDADTWPQLIEGWTDNPQIAARGGSQKFCPLHEISVLLDHMRNSYWGHFGSAQMKSTRSTELVEHVSTTHVLYDKNALDQVGGFDPRLSSSAEDLDLSLRLRKEGFKLQFIPSSFLWHQQARNWKEWARKAFRNGIWQTRLIAYNSEVLKTRRPWPGILIFFLPLLPINLLMVGAFIYLCVIFILSVSEPLRFTQRGQLFALFLMTHFLYALGEMIGVVLAFKDWILAKRLPSSTQS